MDSTDLFCPTCGASNTRIAEHCFACGNSLDAEGIQALTEAPAANILQQRYRLLGMIGEGGFSAVYKAEDLQSKRLVAIKAITLRGLKAMEKIEATDAFNREVRMLTRLEHRNLPRMYDHFSDPECWYLVMDFIDGLTLEKLLEQKGARFLSLEEVFDIALLLCDVLNYLHSQQPAIIFRDLKPGNVMLTKDGHLFLIDFGIARYFKPGQAKDTIPFGSPGYAAPEQYGKAQTTPRADIYSLGVLLHQLRSGNDPSHTPFSFDSLHRDRRDLGELIAQMVQMDVEHRPANIAIVKQHLQRIATENAHFRALQSPGTSGLRAGQQLPYIPRPSYTATLSPWTVPAQGLSNNIYIPFSGQPTRGQQSVQRQRSQAQMQPGQMQQGSTQKQKNRYAQASICLSIVGIFLPIYCLVQSIILLLQDNSHFFLPILLIVLMLVPLVLSIIFGHIGRRRARQFRSQLHTFSTATTGMVIGYVFTGIYLICTLCPLAIFISTTR